MSKFLLDWLGPHLPNLFPTLLEMDGAYKKENTDSLQWYRNSSLELQQGTEYYMGSDSQENNRNLTHSHRENAIMPCY